MSLMQDHNTDQYQMFLEFVQLYKLHFLCCCGRQMVVKQLNRLKSEPVDNQIDCNQQIVDETEYETHDISSEHGKIDVRLVELTSMESKKDKIERVRIDLFRIFDF
eukprot:363281_1